MTSVYGTKRDLSETGSGSARYELAKRRAHEWNEGKGKLHGFAKPVCQLVARPELTAWYVSKITITVIQDGNTQQQRPLTGSFSLSSATHPIPGVQGLLVAVDDLLDQIHSNAEMIAEPRIIKYKLNKLLVYLVRLTEWPFPKNTPEDFTKTFTDYRKSLESKSILIKNQEKILTMIKQINKKIHTQSMSLEEINLKILTKSQRAINEGKKFFDRIQQLFQEGTKKVFQLESPASKKRVDEFNRLFALHAYVYEPDANIEQAEKLLADQLEKLVGSLVAYDQCQNSSTLLEFFMDMMHKLIDHFNSTRDLGATWGRALASTFESLVNQPAFLEYMQRPARQQDALSPLLCTLFEKDKTWRAVAIFIVVLGNRDLFKEVLASRIDEKARMCTLNEKQMDVIFYHLNETLQLQESLFAKAYREMYLDFINLLMRVNKLHFLKPYAQDSKYSKTLRDNLVRLDFSFMSDNTLSLGAFFGNAGLRAVSCRDKNMPRSIDVKSSLVHLFGNCGENPVVDTTAFNAALIPLMKDFGDGFELLAQELLRAIGESTGRLGLTEENQDTLIPVEQWLTGKVAPIYRSIKKTILRCLPVEWKSEKLRGTKNLLGQVCIHNQNLYLIDQNDQRHMILRNLITNEARMPETDEFLVTESLEKVKRRLSKSLKKPENVRLSISQMAQGYLLLQNNPRAQEMMSTLLDILFEKMKQSNESVSFEQRLRVVVNLIYVMAPLFNHLDSLIEKRLFSSDNLKRVIALELVKSARELSPPLPIGPLLSGVNPTGGETLRSADLVAELSQLFSSLCIRAIGEILEKSSLTELEAITAHLESFLHRFIDKVTYAYGDFTQPFKNHNVSRSGTTEALLTAAIGQGDLSIEIARDYKNLLNSGSIPTLVLPNQALAIQLCKANQYVDKNLLVKMESGPNRSLVIALTAIHEAERLTNANSRIFALYKDEYVAGRDYRLGNSFFKKRNIESTRISNITDLDTFTPGTKIIYSDLKTIEQIARRIMVKILTNEASAEEKDFIKTIVGIETGDISIILDEFDILLDELKAKQPLSDPLAKKLLKRIEWPQDQKAPLMPAVVRLSKMIGKAKRVIGFSETAFLDPIQNLTNAISFDIPSSYSPEVFERKIQDTEVRPTGNEPCIYRHKYREINQGFTEGLDETHVPESAIKDYCDSILKDILRAGKEQKNASISYRRPILIFANPLFTYKTQESGLDVKLWDTLKMALTNAGIQLYEVGDNVSDSEMRKIAQSGMVTLANMEFGGRANIPVPFGIEEGLHVIIASPVNHKSSFYQLVGRAGGMGQQGSYSYIVLGKQSGDNKSKPEFYDALHDLTRFSLNWLFIGNQSNDQKRQWLTLLEQSYSQGKINKATIMALCGDKFEENVIPTKFFERF